MTLLTYHDANYKSLANATNPIIKKYCEKHNYVFRSRNEPYLKNIAKNIIMYLDQETNLI